MASIYDSLLENSVDAALASIEVYNKPNFPHREQIFSVLVINAWELLLKARILALNGDNINSIYVSLPDGSFKTNRAGNYLTVEILGAVRQLGLAPSVANNIRSVVEIRDTAIHFFHDESIVYLVYALGVASLRNYQRLIQDWFGQNLNEYNFFIMPLGFNYNFQTLRMLDLNTKPDTVSNLIKAVLEFQEQLEEEDEHHLLCEVNTTIVSAKKVTADTDITTKIATTDSPDAIIVTRTQSLTDRYPYSYTKLTQKVKQAKPRANNNHINSIIRDFDIKNNRELSSYNFPNKDKELEYKRTGKLPSNAPSIYNEDAVRFVIAQVDNYVPPCRPT